MKKKIKNDLKLFLIVIFAFVMGGVITLGLLKFTPIISNLVDTTGTIITKNETQVYERSSLAPAVEKIYDATVLIQGYKNGSIASTGTGFVYKVDSKYGYLLTNQHVIKNIEKVELIMSNDKTVDAEILGGDEYLDLAVLRIPKSEVIQVANIGNSENAKIGDTVFTVGSPMGFDYRGSVTSGILSGKERMVTVSVSSSSNDWVMRVLQLDASINPGNSGGPLLNVNGEVIGICSLKLVDDQIEGMGFAIPIEYAMSHSSALENKEEIKWPVLGINMLNVTDTSMLYRYSILVDKNIKEGVVVVDTTDGSGAKQAGLKKGDVITALAGKKVKDIAYLRYELYQHNAGDRVEITYIRDGKENKADVVLGSYE